MVGLKVKRAPLIPLVAACITAWMLSGCAGGAGTTGHDATQACAAAKQDDAAKGRAASRARLKATVAAAQQQMQPLLEAYKGQYTEICLKPVYPSGIEVVYVLSRPIDASAAKRLDTTVPIMQATVDTLIGPEMKASGFAHPTVTFTYLNPDKSLIWTRTITDAKSKPPTPS